MIFINTPTEKITDLTFSNVSIDTINNSINKTRLSNPNNIIRITLSGNFIVTDSPILLSNKMLLILSNATIQANSNTTATSLINVSSDTMVSIGSTKNGILDGGNDNLMAINITNSGKTHIDGLMIQNCKIGGIYYAGRGANTYADAGSITRCSINNCGSYGISFNSSFNFICTDNTIQYVTLGIHINGNNSAISNNLIKNCTTGIESVSGNEAITYNNIDSCTTGISLTNSSSQTVVLHNNLFFNTIGINCNGTKSIIYYNNFNNTKPVASSGNYNLLFNNFGINTSQGNVSGCTYFNPPTIGNQHKDLIKVGESRYDITIMDTVLTAIRSILDSLHNLNSNTVIVAHLNGTFTAPSIKDSLIIKDDECILLNGTINGYDSCSRLISFADGCTSSFSGGVINGNNIDGKMALVYITATSNVVIDSVSVINSYGQGIEKKSSTVPTFIRASTVNNINGRCIWDVSGQRLIALENSLSNGKNDGIDLDAGSTFCIVEKNKCFSNIRNGVFIEEGAKNHIVLGNTLKNNVCGLEFYNLAVNNQNSSRNLVANNICTANYRGILVSAATTTKASTDNVIFNNICSNNTDVGIGGFYNGTNTFNNYTALNTMSNNTNGPFYSAANFTNNYVWNLIANPKILPIGLISFEGKVIGNSITLNWAIAENSFYQFEIERSSNAVDFNKIASETNSLNINYKFQDNEPIEGVNYYRIKIFDVDGAFSFSSIIQVKFIRVGNLRVKCFQPSKEKLEVSVSSKSIFNRLSINLYDLLGKMVLTNEFNNLNSLIFDKTFMMPFERRGFYILSIKSDWEQAIQLVEIR